MPGAFTGLLLHWVGGFAAASFYVPYKGVRRWSWEVFWIAGGAVSWIIAPWLFALAKTRNLMGVLGATSNETLFLCYVFGFAWGLGGLTFGLTLRYLGLSLGMAVALGLTTAFGTLVPPLWDGSLSNLIATAGGKVVLLGIAVTLSGILVIALAGNAKDRDLVASGGANTVAEFNFRKGILVAIFSGVMSASFAYGLAAGDEIRTLTLTAGTHPLSQGLPVLCVILAGGFTTNLIWCGYLIVKNGTASQFIGRDMVAELGSTSAARTSLPLNYLLCALAGLTWYLQFFFYTMGESKMGEDYTFASWTLHMASIIVFSTLWGIFFKEWNGVSRRTKALVGLGIALLVGAKMIIGWGNQMGG
jgi:L-rhamnose-H+ transport protein